MKNQCVKLFYLLSICIMFISTFNIYFISNSTVALAGALPQLETGSRQPSYSFRIEDGFKIYTLTNVMINDNPYIMQTNYQGGSIESVEDLYTRNPLAFDTYIQQFMDYGNMKELIPNHTGYTIIVKENKGPNNWEDIINRSTQDGYEGVRYNFNEVSESLNRYMNTFPTELQQLLNKMDKTEKKFVVKDESRVQTELKWSIHGGRYIKIGHNESGYKPGDLFVLYYDNIVYVDAELDIKISCEETDCDDIPPPIKPPSGGVCVITFNESNASSMNLNHLQATPNGSIYSSTDEFDVIQGIPTSEDLTIEASSEEYLFNQEFQQKSGKVTYNGIKATKEVTLTWTEEKTSGTGDKKTTTKTPKSEKVTVETTVDGIQRDFSYWQSPKYDVWKASSADFTNYALPNGEQNVPVSPPVTANASHSNVVEDHVFPKECPEIILPATTVTGGTTKPSPPDISGEAKGAAEAAIGQPDVENDSVTFKGNTLMSDTRTTSNGPTPSNTPTPGRVTAIRENLTIEPTKTNYFESPSTGKFNYQIVFTLGGAESTKTFPFPVNVVTVHTPTVIYSEASDDKQHDQRTNPPTRSTPANPDADRHAFILDRPFTVTMPTIGQHRAIPGYGNRDFAKYIKEKQVKFPFDVYTSTKAGFYPAETWITVPVDIDTVEFFLPVWVPEGEYTVEFRSFAINALTTGDFGGTEHHANITIPNGQYNVPPAGALSAAHVATDSIEVDVVGRLYDLHVTDITDYNWQSVFRESDGFTSSGSSYWVGQNGIDGDIRGNTELFTLPVRHGSHPAGYKNVAVKKGYTFRFDMKTKGDMFEEQDAIRIKPTFYFVSKDGLNRQEVDLYYHDEANYFVKVGSAEDTVNREIKLNETARNVPQVELIANADYYYRHAGEYTFTETVADYFPTSWGRQYLKHLTKQDVTTGPYGWQILNWKLRTYRGPEENVVPANTMVPAEDIVAREQTWYSEYSIPTNAYVVPKDSSINEAGILSRLNENHPIFLKDGYIIVNFDIETIQDGDLDNPYLQYINAKLMNQWVDMEGFKHSFVDLYGNTFNSLDGDVLYYHGDASSDLDFSPSVTH